MKLVLTFCFTGSLIASAAMCRVSQAEVCRHCNSGSCGECTVKVGVYGYSRPTWRPWPTTKEETPGERKKTDRRLIRPEPYETPSPESEADGVPGTTPRRIDPIPVPVPREDDPPALPPQSSMNSLREPAMPLTAKPSKSENDRADIVDKRAVEPAQRRIASLNVPVSAELPAQSIRSNNPLRMSVRTASRSNPTRRSATNAPVAIRVGGVAHPVAANPLAIPMGLSL